MASPRCQISQMMKSPCWLIICAVNEWHGVLLSTWCQLAVSICNVDVQSIVHAFFFLPHRLYCTCNYVRINDIYICMEWNYLSIPKLQRLHSWSLGMDKLFHPTCYNGCNNVSMLGLTLNHVSKRGPRFCCVLLCSGIGRFRQPPGRLHWC